jgi:hypothetical protein
MRVAGVLLLAGAFGIGIGSAQGTQPAGITVVGVVTNGTAGTSAPVDQPITLHLATTSGWQTTTTPTQSDGRFQFTSIPAGAGDRFYVSMVYRERPFLSPLQQVEAGRFAYEAPLAVYELTEDPFVVGLRAMDTQIDAIAVGGLGEGLAIAQTMRLANASDRAFTSQRQLPDGRFVTLRVEVPPGAILLNDADAAAYALAEDGRALLTTAPVLPGEDHIISLAYFLPYRAQDGARIEQALPTALNGEATFQVDPALALDGPGLVPAGGAGAYVLDGAAVADGILRYTISGDPFAQPAPAGGPALSSTLLAIALVAGAGAGLGLLALLASRRGPGPGDVQAALDALDAAHAVGTINHDVYRRQRAALEAQRDGEADQ